jgi:hypothetical protein
MWQDIEDTPNPHGVRGVLAGGTIGGFLGAGRHLVVAAGGYAVTLRQTHSLAEARLATDATRGDDSAAAGTAADRE